MGGWDGCLVSEWGVWRERGRLTDRQQKTGTAPKFKRVLSSKHLHKHTCKRQQTRSHWIVFNPLVELHLHTLLCLWWNRPIQWHLSEYVCISLWVLKIIGWSFHTPESLSVVLFLSRGSRIVWTSSLQDTHTHFKIHTLMHKDTSECTDAPTVHAKWKKKTSSLMFVWGEELSINNY